MSLRKLRARRRAEDAIVDSNSRITKAHNRHTAESAGLEAARLDAERRAKQRPYWAAAAGVAVVALDVLTRLVA